MTTSWVSRVATIKAGSMSPTGTSRIRSSRNEIPTSMRPPVAVSAARQAVEQFRRHDEALLREQAAIEGENEGRYLALANEGRDRLAALLAREQRPDARSGERSDW